MKTRTKTLINDDKHYVWHPFTQMKDWLASDNIVIERGKGNWLIDTEGRKYLDGVSSLWTNLHGHRKKEIDEAIKTQLDKIGHSTLLGLANVPSIALAKKLAQIAPKGLDHVFYSDDGSTAVEVGLKMSLQYWQLSGAKDKRLFVAFTGAYHGDTFGGMSVGEIDVFVARYRPLLFKSIRSPYPYCYRCPIKKRWPDCSLACLDVFEKLLAKHHKKTAACIIEPGFEGASGMIVAPPGFLKGVRRLTKKYNCLLIADEVASGFGRTGRMFSCDHEGVTPDMLCLAKGLTAGYLPLAATLTTDDVFNAFLGERCDAFFHGHTYTGNPLGCSAALANLRIFEKEDTLEAVKLKIALLKELLEESRALPHVGDVRQTGLVAAIELVADRRTKKAYPAEERIGRRVSMEARRLGLFIRPLGDVIVIMPPLSIKANELRMMINAINKCIRKVTES
ncbi:MAG: adenosylmethionine--8-amino-7-oxononanoate transaminase [Deltaproteobacteria bacterium]|nr:adenosylmethionine--8-amino-7-oxononanoate transaminase [Deltaproteobacteria bacterium]